MKPTARTAAHSRPNRLLIALAAAWMILSLAIGGAVNAGSSPTGVTTTSAISETVQP